jgi:LCP family protein required for cell wall assembly
MKDNKSIDGLTTRAVKKPAPKPASKPVAKKVVKKEVIKTPAKKADKVVVRADVSTVKVTTGGKTPKKAESQTVDDFLKPVQAFDFDSESGELKESKMTKKELKAEKKAEKKLAKAEKKAGKKSHKVRNIIASIILILVLAASGVIVWAVFWGNDIIAKITGGQGNVFDLLTFMDDHYEPLKTDANGRTNILAIGTSGYNMDGDEGNGTHAGAQLTDSIMMISLNQDTGDIAMLSLPRDLKASPTCTATSKINEVYWCNGGKGQASIEEEATANQAVMTEVGGILGVDFQYFVHVNWGSLETIVNLLDGITIKLDEDIMDYGWTGSVYEAGVEYTINGDQAVGLARARHGTVGGDFSRGASQQKILIGIKNKLVEKDLSITDYLSLAGTLGDNFRSNFSMEELKTLAHLSYLFDLDSMRQISLFDPANGIYYMKTANINGISYVIPSAGVGNYGAIQDVVATLLNNDPRTYEQPKIAIFNATDTDGIATEQKSKLEAEGYTITAIDNITGSFENDYMLYDITERTPGTKTMLEDYFGTTARKGADIPENIPRDYDLVLVLSPSPSSENESE